ncbi:MAG TPA: RNA pseudouridine synthase [Candidatus Absconditabacterales bacterium]|nr:RNA pseudouridine synthase [Candidatus Absconditabacterales bacterium]
MEITHYQDDRFFYFRKPHGVPSTFGKQKCFIDFLLESKDPKVKEITSYLQNMFAKEEEYGLVNRLDNDTSGLLYFVKTPLFKQKYKDAQKKGEIQKHYVAEVYGKCTPESQKISNPIGHHKFSSDRMVAVKDTKQTNKTKGKLIYVDTFIEKLYYDETKNTTVLLVNISKGIRHQIRTHLSSIGYPIVGEQIYIKKKSSEKLQLFSLGLSRKY